MEKSPCLFTVEKDTKKATFEITRTCNYTCQHCCTSSSLKVSEKLDTNALKRALDNISLYEVNTLYISGGEPFFREDIREIIEYISELNSIKKVNIASNGGLIDVHIAHWLNQVETLGTVLVSVDGHIPEIHDKFRLAEKGFGNAINAIRNLVNESVKVRFGTVIWKESRPYLKELAELAESLNVFEMFYNWLMPTGRGATSRNIELSPSEYLPVGREIERIKEYYHGSLRIGFHRFRTIDDSYNDCPGGENYFHILDDGRVSPCSWIAKLDPSFTSRDKITEKPLETILRGEEIQRFRDMVRLRREAYGSGCPAVTLAEESTYFAFDPLRDSVGLYFQLDKDGKI